ncbi:MAG TPA: FAD-dependent oxidoreductase, partial [Devosia sp.]|nr:FAD-dependent oxidoreductase [Devosia sp.]
MRLAAARGPVVAGFGRAPRSSGRRLRRLCRGKLRQARNGPCRLSQPVPDPLMALPPHAQFVVIGGGIIGCSTAYHLAKEHKADVVLLEQGKLTSGSTWHAAGLVGQLRSSASITQVLKRSVELYKTLEAETGLATGWKMTG